MASLTLRERTLIGLAVAGLLIVFVYLYGVEPLIVRSRELAELAPAREATLEARRRLIEQQPRLIRSSRGRACFEPVHAPASGTDPPRRRQTSKLVKGWRRRPVTDVRSERVLPAWPDDGLQEIADRLTVAGASAIPSPCSRSSVRRGSDRQGRQGVVAISQPRELLAISAVAVESK
jgi:hypothetical protein